MSGLPPSLGTLAVRQTLRWVRDPLPLLDECHARLGDRFTLRLAGAGNWVMVSDPADVKALFTAPADVLHAGEVNRRLFGHFAGSASSFVMDGPEHLRHRRLALPAFHGERMHAYAGLIREAVREVMATWPTDEPFALMPHLRDVILRVTVRAVFGGGGSGEQALRERLTALDDRAFTSPLSLLPALALIPGRFGPLGQVRAEVARTDRLLFEQIALRRTEPDAEDRQDILSMLLRARDTAGQALTDTELRDELVSALLAGTHTTGTAMAWCFERLLSEPEVRQRVEEELATVVGAQDVEPAHLSRLPYLDAVIKECLRARPIAPVGGMRLVKRSFALGPYVLPPGTIVASCAYLTFKRPDLYDDPEAFRPERFLGKRDDPYGFAAFGGGPRRCLGMSFATYLLKAVLATAFTRSRLEIVAPHARPSRYAFFVAPERGLPVFMRSARAPASSSSAGPGPTAAGGTTGAATRTTARTGSTSPGTTARHRSARAPAAADVCVEAGADW